MRGTRYIRASNSRSAALVVEMSRFAEQAGIQVEVEVRTG